MPTSRMVPVILNWWALNNFHFQKDNGNILLSDVAHLQLAKDKRTFSHDVLPSVESSVLSVPPFSFLSFLNKLCFLCIILSLYLWRNGYVVMREKEKHIITLCLFEFLSSCCYSYSCYIDWCPYEPGYCLTSPPTFAQIRKINKITAATPALLCTNPAHTAARRTKLSSFTHFGQEGRKWI